ncbi:MAG: VCBS repeat-containing protein, partial [Planctomycetes bacterium]|nr:VCBS repeat-containing protein [Planctomycetota bacterium]
MIHISIGSGAPMRTKCILGAALFACAVAVTAGVPRPALGEVVAEYSFDDVDDGMAHDTSGHGHDGTIVGDPATVTGFAGNALSFDGLDDYLVVSDTLDLRLDTFAVTVWLRAEKIPTRDSTVLEKWQDGQGYRLQIDGASGGLEFEIGGGSGARYAVQAPFPVFGNVWTTATATYDGTELALYIDGSLEAQTAASGLDIKNEADLFIAGDAAQDRLFEGDIDEVVIDNATALASDVCTTAQKLWHASSGTCLDGYTNVTDELGLGAEDKSHFGICLVDVDQDGWVDIYYANGKGEPTLPEEPVDGVCQDLDGIPPHPLESENTFYRNLGDGTFGPDIAPALGIADIWTAMRNVWGDYDNDGLRDLMSHNFLRSPLYHAVSADPMWFEDVSEEAGVELCLLRGTGASWVDLDRDGWLDLYAVEYAVGPAENLINPMYINNRDGTFTEITAEAGVDDPNNPMGTTFADYDNDGDQDVFVPNSPPTPTRLYRNDGVQDTGLPHFTDVAVEAGVAISDQGNKGVSVGWGDYNNDGRLDLLFGREYDSRLWRNDGPNSDGVWTFTDITGQGGLDIAGHRFWGGNFADLDNDGWLDIVMTNKDAPGPNRIYLNSRDGTWREVSELLEMDLPDEQQMGFVAGDLDTDGDLEVVLLGFTSGHPNSVFRNQSRGNNWIQFRLTGTVSNRDAVGTRITLTAAAQPG